MEKFAQLKKNRMKKEIRTEITINATPEKVWAILTDFDKYKEWNPFIKSLEGNVKVGNQIKVVISPPDGSAMTFKPKVLVFESERELTWLGTLVFKGLFDGEHSFRLKANSNGTTTFIQSESFSGILVGLFSGTLEKTRKGFESMNEKLKSLAENE